MGQPGLAAHALRSSCAVPQHSGQDPAVFHTAQQNPASRSTETAVSLFVFSVLFVTLSARLQTDTVCVVTPWVVLEYIIILFTGEKN